MACLQLPRTQVYLAEYLTEWLDETYQIDLVSKRVNLTLFSGLQIEDVQLIGEQGDTLFSIPEIRMMPSNFSLSEFKTIYLDEIALYYNAEASWEDSELVRIINSLKSDESTNKLFKIDKLFIKDARVRLQKAELLYQINHLNLFAKDVSLAQGIELILSNLDFEIESGTKHQINAKSIQFSSEHNSVKDFHWESAQSHFDLNFDHDIIGNKGRLQIEKFIIEEKSLGGLYDIWPSGIEVEGSLIAEFHKDSLWLENLSVKTNHNSSINLNVRLENWRDSSQWKYLITSENFLLSEDEWLWIEDLFAQDYLMSRLGTIRASGECSGTLEYLELNSVIRSDYGALNTELTIAFKDSLALSEYSGNLNFKDLDMAVLTEIPNFGLFNADVTVSGRGLNVATFDTEVQANINSLEYGSYKYSNIDVQGRLQPFHFVGDAVVSDENLDLTFQGEVDLSQEKPLMDFVADIVLADLYALNLYQKDSIALLSTLLEMNFEGDRWDNIQGDIGVYFTTVETTENYYHFDDLHFSAKQGTVMDQLSLESDFAKIKLEGVVDIPNLYHSFSAYLSNHLPILATPKKGFQDFSFHVELFNTAPLTSLLLPSLRLGDGAVISGSFNDREEGLVLDVFSPNLTWKEWLWEDLSLSSTADENNWKLNLQGAALTYGKSSKFQNIEYDQIGNHGDWRFSLAWAGLDSIRNEGVLKALATVDEQSINLSMEETQFYFADTLWTLSNLSSLVYDKNNSIESSVRIFTAGQEVQLTQEKSKNNNSLQLLFEGFELANFSPWLNKSRTDLSGGLDGIISVNNLSDKPVFEASMQIPDFAYNYIPIGLMTINGDWNEQDKIQSLHANISKDGEKRVDMYAYYMPDELEDNFTMRADFMDIKLAHLQTYLSAVFDEVEGEANGYLHYYGTLNSPQMEGQLQLENAALHVPYLNTSYKFIEDPIVFINDMSMDFKDISLKALNEDSKLVGQGLLNGVISHDYFKDIYLDLRLDADSLICLNTDAYKDEAYYGRAIASGQARFSGFTNNTAIRIDAQTKEGTSIHIPLDDGVELDELSFVHFVEKDKFQSDTLWLPEPNIKTTGLSIDMNIEITPEATVELIFDETVGDKISANGTGFINLGMASNSDLYMFGDYIVQRGDYLFTLQNIVNKKFEIENGGRLVWNGDPYKAQMDLSALYRILVSTKDLSQDYDRKTEVECRMMMQGDLFQPEIEFDIQIPNADENLKRIVNERTNTDEKKTQQFLSLLVLNSFLSTDELENTDVNYLNSTLSTGTEMLSNQLSNWLSQTNEKFDLGVKYHPNLGDTLSNREFELLLSNLKVNDRITVNGNIGTQPAQNTTRIIGDFKVEYNISKDGSLRLKAFRNLEESFLLEDENNYTTGLGLFYRDEFESFKELWQKLTSRFIKGKG